MSNRIPFDGETYDAERDHDRLASQLLDVWRIMRTGKWYTLRDLTGLTGHPEASVSARIRDLKKLKIQARLGIAVTVETDAPEAGGVWHYRLNTLGEAHHTSEITMTNPSLQNLEETMSEPASIMTEAQFVASHSTAAPTAVVAPERTRRKNPVTIDLSDEGKALAILLGLDPENLVSDLVTSAIKQRIEALRKAI